MTPIEWSRNASADFDSILDYLGGETSLAATRQTGFILESIHQLGKFPGSGKRNAIRGTRQLVVPRTPYAVYYRRVRGIVEILTIRHGARRPLKRIRKN